ncbi:hypothetical protein [Eisenibacter elegans]|uniref:hypothetical protein n=1 Tax=Eisenibacter elegans TaxID=997 RepID=UPI00040F1CF8|nr:hypothetical protein [Eisenibacter elegans]
MQAHELAHLEKLLTQYAQGLQQDIHQLQQSLEHYQGCMRSPQVKPYPWHQPAPTSVPWEHKSPSTEQLPICKKL